MAFPDPVANPAGLSSRFFLTTAMCSLLAVCGVSGPPRQDEIAFVSGESDVYAVLRDGSGLRPITSGPAFDLSPEWSPDRRRLLFIRAATSRNSGHVMVVNADGSELVQLTSGEGAYWDAVWSPNGTHIAVTKGDPNGLHVYVMDAAGSGLAPLVETESVSPSWSPDGRFLAFAGNPRGGEADGIYRVDVRTGNIDLLVAAPETLNQSPVWSPDGKHIAFIRIWLGSEGGQTTTIGSDLFIVDADGTNLRQLKALEAWSSPTWSPDGRAILSLSGRANSLTAGHELLVVDTKDGETRRLATPGVYGFEPDWA